MVIYKADLYLGSEATNKILYKIEGSAGLSFY